MSKMHMTAFVLMLLAAPLSYGDVAVVELAVKSIGTTSTTFVYRIRRRRDGVPCFAATVTTVLIDLDSQKPQPIPADLRTILETEMGQG